MLTEFLIFSLFLPRCTLLYFYIFLNIPYNTVPFFVDSFTAICLPRVLILIYIAENLGTNSDWFLIHFIFAIISFISISSSSSSNKN